MTSFSTGSDEESASADKKSVVTVESLFAGWAFACETIAKQPGRLYKMGTDVALLSVLAFA
jgi:hypothetical protein